MYNLVLVSTQNISFYNLFWTLFTYTADFNSTNKVSTIDKIYFTNAPNINYQFTYNKYSFQCPNKLSLVDCKCKCENLLMGISFYNNYCESRTTWSENCQIEIKCLNKTKNFDSSIDTDVYSVSTSTMGKNFSCLSAKYQLMTSCNYYIITGLLNSTVNVTAGGQLNYMYPPDNITQNGTGQILEAFNSQFCRIEPSSLSYAKNLIKSRPIYYAEVYFTCITIKCPALKVNLNCTQLIYTNLAQNKDIIWGTLANFVCTNSSCLNRNLSLECTSNGTWNESVPIEECLSPVTLTTNKIKFSNGTWTNWTLSSCLVNNSYLELGSCLKLDLNVIELLINIIENSTKENLENIEKNLKIELVKLQVKYSVPDSYGQFGGIIVCLIAGFLIFFIILSDFINILKFF